MINAFMVQFALSIAIHSHVIYGYLNDELNASIVNEHMRYIRLDEFPWSRPQN